jgi:predicted XRE-type DNA-binding protein
MKMSRAKHVFKELGFSDEESGALAMKSDLHAKILRSAKGYSQAQLQKLFNETQPRISDLLRGKLSKFSLETLIRYAEALNMRPEIRTHPPNRAVATVRA